MPIVSISSQPATDSLNAAYRPIAFTIKAKKTDLTSTPPVVYCDIYINDTFYKTIAKSQYQTLNTSDTDWYFDIQDATQEVFQKPISPNGGSLFYATNSVFAAVYCKFRSSGFDSDGFIKSENIAPVQGTGTTDPVPGTGTQSHIFFVVNSVLQHVDNQDLSLHLNSYKTGTWDSEVYPLTHRTSNYRICQDSSDYFPILSLEAIPNCLRINYKLKGDSDYTQVTTCGIEISGIEEETCENVAILGSPVLPNAQTGVLYDESIFYSGTETVSIGSITKPDWMSITIDNVNHLVHLTGTPTSGDAGTAIPIGFTLTNCTDQTAPFSQNIDVVDEGEIGGTDYALEQIGTCIDNLTQFNITGGVEGDVIIVQANFSGVIQKVSGLFTRADVSIASPDGTPTSDIASSACYTDTSMHSFNITAEISITMPGATSTMSGTATTNNSFSSMSSVAYKIISVNGSAVSVTAAGCKNNNSVGGTC